MILRSFVMKYKIYLSPVMKNSLEVSYKPLRNDKLMNMRMKEKNSFLNTSVKNNYC